jgi:hypothetical protein
MNARRQKIVLSATVALTLTACSICGLNHDLGLVKPGMRVNEVEALLGRPASIEETVTADQAVAAEVYHYSTPIGEARVVFVNGAVFKSEFPGDAKS